MTCPTREHTFQFSEVQFSQRRNFLKRGANNSFSRRVTANTSLRAPALVAKNNDILHFPTPRHGICSVHGSASVVCVRCMCPFLVQLAMARTAGALTLAQQLTVLAEGVAHFACSYMWGSSWEAR